MIWQGSLQPAPEAPTLVLGTMSMVAEENVTLVGVGVHGGEAGLRLGWRVREGSCAAPGDPLASSSTAFPEFVLNESGEGESQTALLGRAQDAPTYAGQLFAAGGASGGQLLACANLTRQN